MIHRDFMILNPQLRCVCLQQAQPESGVLVKGLTVLCSRAQRSCDGGMGAE